MKYFRHLKQLEQLTYFLLLVLLPSQLGSHFWPDASLLFGFRIDYLSPTLYLTDLLILLNAIFFLTRHHKTIIPHISSAFYNIPNFFKIFLLLFLCIIILQLFVTTRPLLTFLSLLAIIKFSYLAIYTAVARPLSKPQFFIGLAISLSWTYLLTILQWFNHGSLQGLWYWLGERSYSLNQPGIPASRFCFNTNECLTSLRPMATFSHPNSLAGYFVVASLLTLGLFPSKLLYATFTRTFILIGLFTILLLTASQAAWLAAAIATISFLIPKQWYKPIVWLSMFCFILTPFILGHLTYNTLDLTSRQLYQSAAFKLIIHHPLIGLGLNQYLPALPTLTDYPLRLSSLQPVHHVGLLLTSYIGLPFVVFIIYILGKYLPQCISNSTFIPPKYALAIYLVIFTTASFDHYWLTLHQNQLLLALIIGLQITSEKTASAS